MALLFAILSIKYSFASLTSAGEYVFLSSNQDADLNILNSGTSFGPLALSSSSPTLYSCVGAYFKRDTSYRLDLFGLNVSVLSMWIYVLGASGNLINIWKEDDGIEFWTVFVDQSLNIMYYRHSNTIDQSFQFYERKWNIIIFTWESPNYSCSIYTGNSEDPILSGIDTSSFPPTGTLNIGSNGSYGTSFLGFLYEIRIFEDSNINRSDLYYIESNNDVCHPTHMCFDNTCVPEGTALSFLPGGHYIFSNSEGTVNQGDVFDNLISFAGIAPIIYPCFGAYFESQESYYLNSVKTNYVSMWLYPLIAPDGNVVRFSWTNTENSMQIIWEFRLNSYSTIQFIYCGELSWSAGTFDSKSYIGRWYMLLFDWSSPQYFRAFITSFDYPPDWNYISFNEDPIFEIFFGALDSISSKSFKGFIYEIIIFSGLSSHPSLTGPSLTALDSYGGSLALWPEQCENCEYCHPTQQCFDKSCVNAQGIPCDSETCYLCQQDSRNCSCEKGFYFGEDGLCHSKTYSECDLACTECSNYNQCLNCIDNTYLDNGKCYCFIGYFNYDSKQCQNCQDSLCKTCKTIDNCFICKDKTTLRNGICYCDSQYSYSPSDSCQGISNIASTISLCSLYFDPNVCCICVDHANLEANSCSCKSRFYDNGAGQCEPCGTGCSLCEKSDKCTQCDNPKAIKNVDGSCSCPDKYYASFSNNMILSCLDCPEGCKTCNENECTECILNMSIKEGVCMCNEGFYQISDGNGISCACKCYLACSDNCNKCDPDPDCHLCGAIGSKTQNQCYDKYIPYTANFNNGLLTITFVENLTKILSKKNFEINPNDGRAFNSSSWNLTRVSAKEYHIETDIKESDLPINIFLHFGQN